MSFIACLILTAAAVWVLYEPGRLIYMWYMHISKQEARPNARQALKRIAVSIGVFFVVLTVITAGTDTENGGTEPQVTDAVIPAAVPITKPSMVRSDLPQKIAEAERMIDEDETIKPADKEMFKQAASRALHSEPRCLSVFTAGSSFDRPSYFIHCNPTDIKAPGFNIYFTKAEMAQGYEMTAAKPYTEAATACRDALKRRATHVSTFEPSWLPPNTQVNASGVTSVVMDFTLKNSYGVKLSMVGYCLVQPDGRVNIQSMKERQ